ncbi:MAG: radical SAM protein [Elusimicrobiota bacterium]|jgi:radical SAM superfamily enzyme YgiQ (UPF0313 family)
MAHGRPAREKASADRPRRARVALIVPPAETRNNECFPVPNISIPTLAAHLRRKRIDTTLHDFDVPFHLKVKPAHPWTDFSLLRDPHAVARWLSGKLKGKGARSLEAAAAALAPLCDALPEADLYGLTLADLKTPFLLNAAALLADEIRRRTGKPVVIGHKDVSKQLYYEILRDYPCFDYAVVIQGERELEQLAHAVVERERRLPFNVYRRTSSGRVLKGVMQGHYPPLTFPDYRGYPLELYRRTGRRILASYNASGPAFRRLLAEHGGREQLVLMSRFESHCAGQCIFCSSQTRSDRRTPAEVVEHLRALKDQGATGVYFINANFNNHYDFALELCGRMVRARLGLQWCDCVNFRQLDERLLEKMRESGAVKLTFGLETGSARLLRYIRKGTTPERASRFLRRSHALGIWNHIEIIGGLPTETPADVADTVRFLEEHRDCIDVHSLNPFYLYPGSPLYRTPGRFGVSLRPAPAGALDPFSADEFVSAYSERFDEVGGLSWEAKDRQIMDSTRAVTETLERIQPTLEVDSVHIELLMFLYSVFGHARKGVISRLVRLATRRFKPFGSDQFLSPSNAVKTRYRRVLRPRVRAGKEAA